MLAEEIRNNREQIKEYLKCGYVNWDNLIDRIENQESTKDGDFADEQIWTFIVACGYAIKGTEGINKLCSLLIEKEGYNSKMIWMEVVPTSPRDKEGHTRLDLVVGNIKLRDNTDSGIELESDGHEKPWICFCEMKWYSDISHNVSHDQHRNQLARVIENALVFSNGRDKKFADEVFVNLVTPKIFKNAKSRLYNYKFDEYKKPYESLCNDLTNCRLERTYTVDIKNHLNKLNLKWTTFDELFANIPPSAISKEIEDFEKKYNKAKQ